MTLQFKHFDSRLNQWIHTDGNQLNPDSILAEELDNTLLELYFPVKPFSFGHIDEKTKAEDLYNHPDGHVLLLSSKSRLLYGPAECLETIDKLCPDRKDRGAYGSIFLGSCNKSVLKEMNVLIVDDETGSNGGILPDEVAWRQVGDCHGKISPALAQELSGTVEHVIQHRLGIPNESRFAKGTLAPKNLSQLPYLKPGTQVDLIVPTSSFKGGDKKNNPIQPGLQKITVWLGEKERSRRGKIATSQAHSSFPNGMKDFLRTLEDQSKKLKDIQNDPRKLAQHYCEKYEQRQAFGQNQSKTQGEVESEEISSTDANNEQLMYRLIKADLEGHGQLLETQKVTDELKRFLQREWRDIAIGKTITFDRGMIIPSKDLKHGEICVSWLPEGEESLNFRSPLLNSNGMCVSFNKSVEDALDPNGNPLKGVIVVNDEDHKRIQQRIEALKSQGIETDEIDPLETESERQGRDYDGDCIGVAKASDYPNFTAEAKSRNDPQNAYAPVKKEAKASFFRGDGTQPSFEEIALFMSDSISVGVINNHATALEALESEIDLLKSQATPQQQQAYLEQVGSHYQKLVAQANNPNKPKPIPAQYKQRITQVAQISQSELTPDSITQALDINRSIYHDMIGEAGYQNQIAVDIFKSNCAPDMNVIEENNRLLHRIPNYIRDKKKPWMYVNQPIKPQGLSPVELMVHQANSYFTESALVARPTEQFRNLFPESYTPAQYNQALLAKAEFDQRFNAAAIQNQKRRHEVGPVLKVETTSGIKLEITNLTKFDHPQAFTANTLNLKLVENKHPQAHHQLIALAQVEGEQDDRGNPRYEKLGTVCEVSRQTLGLKAGMVTAGAKVQLAAPLTEKQVQFQFQQAYTKAEEFRERIPPDQRSAVAAAAWHSSTSPETRKEFNTHKTSNFVFAAFGEEIVTQLKELQFTEFLATELRQHNQVPDTLWRDGEQVSLEVKAEDGDRLWYVKDQTSQQSYKLGTVSPKGAQLPIGTLALGKITGDAIATATLNIPKIDQPITFGKMGDFELARHQFNGEQVKVTLKNYQPSPKPILTLDGKEIGELDSRSVEMLKNAGRLKEGTKLEVTLNTLGNSFGTYTLATTALGNTIRANRQAFSETYKDKRFIGEKVTVEVGVKQPKPAMAVFLEVNREKKIAGIFTPNQKSSKSALMTAGLWKDGATFEGNITSNITIAKIEIDHSSVQYPEKGEWISPQKISNTQVQPILQAADTLLAALKKQPSLLHRLDQEWTLPTGEMKELPTLGLSVDATVAASTHEWLNAQGIPHTKVNPNDPNIKPETECGYVVFRMIEADVSTQVRQSMEKQCGEALSAHKTDSSTISPYHQRLKAVAKVNSETVTQKQQQEFSNPQSESSFFKQEQPTASSIPSPSQQSPSPILVDFLELLPSLTLADGDHYKQQLTQSDHTWVIQVASQNELFKKTLENLPPERTDTQEELFSIALETDVYDDLIQALENNPGIATKYFALDDYLEEKMNAIYDLDDSLAEQLNWQHLKHREDKHYGEEIYDNLYDKINCYSKALIKGIPEEVSRYQALAQSDLQAAQQEFRQLPETLGVHREVLQAQLNSYSPLTDSLEPETLTPQQLQSQRTQLVAPIVKSYLEMQGTHHYDGQIHTATWDKSNQILSLVDRQQSSLKLLAKQENGHWTPLAVPLTDPQAPNLSEADVKHFQNLVPQIEANLEAKKTLYRGWYEAVKAQVLANSDGENLSPLEIDRVIALSVLTQSNDAHHVGRVLTQSDLARVWKESLPQPEYQTKLSDHIQQTYQMAQVERQRQEPIGYEQLNR